MSEISNLSAAPGVLDSLPRRATFSRQTQTTPPARMRLPNYRANFWRSALRLLTWLWVGLEVLLLARWDALRGRNTPTQRARRLRRAFERQGGSFAKLGLHLSMRVDFLPWEYCVELSRMEDHARPFPLAVAIQSIERAVRQPLPAVFSRFDPEPIASNSLGCQYQARLHNGQAVTVRVRRPRVGEQFMSDLQAFDWVLALAEALTLVPPGFPERVRGELSDYLLEELDFVEAARRQDSFRRAAAASRQDFFSAPRVYLELTSEEVVVEEFAAGMWLWELLEAVERQEPAGLERARQLNVLPEAVAERLVWVNNWAREAHLFFHADPHPNNIIVGRDGRLYFINFSMTCSLSRSQRQALQENMNYLRQRDPLNMARASLILLEPLPAIDLSQLVQELESSCWELVYALEADPVSLTWPERTSAAQWLGMMQLARKYGIVVDTRVLRLLRATLLAESAAGRLHPALDIEQEYRHFHRYRAEQARRRVTDALTSQLDGQANETLIIRLDRIAHTLGGLLLRSRRGLSLPSLKFHTVVGKWSFAFSILARFAAQVLALTAAAGLLALAGVLLAGGGPPFDPAYILGLVLPHPIYVLLVLVLIFVNGRTVLFRLDDKDT
jgi:ubiquinone biosynthesis protein